MQALYAVNYMDNIVVWVLLEICKLNFSDEVYQSFQLYVVNLQKVVLLEELESQVR